METHLPVFAFFLLMLVSVDCTSQLNASLTPQYLLSPNYPSNYPRSTDEYWLMTTSTLDSSQGSWVINLEVEDFLMEAHSSCAYDYLEIFDGDSESADSLGRLCGSQSALVYSSSGPSLYFHLSSDYSVTDRGFSISYWATFTAFAVVTQAPPPVHRRDYTYHIVGGVLGAAAGLCLIGLIIYCVYRRKYKKEERPRRLVKKVWEFRPDGKIRSTYKTTLQIPKADGDCDDDSITASSRVFVHSRNHRKWARTPVESYAFWGRQVPSPFRYIEPSYPAGYGSTPY